jgi:hypothetical protein
MKPWALSIENPFDSAIDVGKNSYEIRAILESFAVSCCCCATVHHSFMLLPSQVVHMK